MADLYTVEAPALIGIGAQSIVDRAKALGLTWTLRPGTMSETGIIYDGDTESIDAINISGRLLAAGDRVMGLIVPPSGNYIIGGIVDGSSGTNPSFGSSTTWNLNRIVNPGGNTLSAVYSAMPQNPSLDVIKLGTAAQSSLQVTMAVTCYSLIAAIGEIGILINGTTTTLQHMAMGTLSLSYTFSATALIGGLAPGEYTCALMWRTTAGQIIQDLNNWVSLTIKEVAI